MRLNILVFFILFFCKSVLFSQITVPNPSKSDFSGTLSFLASDWMQGRKATEKGGFMAADYIASLMKSYQLVPYNKTDSNYFQDFKIQEHTVKEVTFQIKKGAKETITLSPETDFEATPITHSLNKDAQIVFLGYGLNNIKDGYDDYKNQDVKDKIVVVLSGFPSHRDTASVVYQKFKKIYPEENDLEETKVKNAIDKGAIALIIIELKSSFKPENSKGSAVFHSLENSNAVSIPIFRITQIIASKLVNEILIFEVEKKAALKLQSSAVLLKNTTCHFSIELESKTLAVRNVLGMISGKDTTKTIIIGAHYDHLGMKNDSIYNGADDNASGTSGMLALAKNWSESKIKPPFNLLFASWTAEEMGLLGSEYFAQNLNINNQKIMLALNMDMISRNAPEDKMHRILSIGTQKGNSDLKEIANTVNSKLSNPFSLDLWETNGHSGSDYASFSAKGIPIMTFFSGFHDDYHSPRDIASKVDLDKIKDVLFIVNCSLIKFIENQH
jgi:hypothetical protein